MNAFFSFKCTSTQRLILLIVDYGNACIPLGAIAVSIIYDIFSNFNLLRKCKLKEYLFSRDPFRVRIELSLFITALIVFVLFGIMTISNFSFTIELILIDLLVLIQTLIVVLFPLSITIYRKIISKCSKISKENQNTMDQIFTNPNFLEAFKIFAENEYSIENVEFRIDFEKYKTIGTGNREKFVEKINKKYFHLDSPYEINIDSKTKNQYQKQLETCVFSDDLYDHVMDSVNQNLFDTYGRFITSFEYNAAYSKVKLYGMSFMK